MLRRRSDPDAGERWRPGRIRIALALGVVLGTGAVGVHAYWSDTATLTTGSFASGTLDLTLDGELDGQGGTTTYDDFGLSSMIPGESIASTVTVTNSGTMPFTYVAAGSADGDAAMAEALEFEVYVDAAAMNSGTIADLDRSGTCDGGSSVFGPAGLDPTAQPVTGTARLLDSNESEVFCIVVTLPTTADNDATGEATASLEFTANQLEP